MVCERARVRAHIYAFARVYVDCIKHDIHHPQTLPFQMSRSVTSGPGYVLTNNKTAYTDTKYAK